MGSIGDLAMGEGRLQIIFCYSAEEDTLVLFFMSLNQEEKDLLDFLLLI